MLTNVAISTCPTRPALRRPGRSQRVCPSRAIVASEVAPAASPHPLERRRPGKDPLPGHAWSSSVAAARETTGPSRIKRAVDVGALLQLTRPQQARSTLGLLPDMAALQAVMQSQAGADPLAYDGVRADTLVLLVELAGRAALLSLRVAEGIAPTARPYGTLDRPAAAVEAHDQRQAPPSRRRPRTRSWKRSRHRPSTRTSAPGEATSASLPRRCRAPTAASRIRAAPERADARSRPASLGNAELRDLRHAQSPPTQTSSTPRLMRMEANGVKVRPTRVRHIRTTVQTSR